MSKKAVFCNVCLHYKYKDTDISNQRIDECLHESNVRRVNTYYKCEKSGKKKPCNLNKDNKCKNFKANRQILGSV